MELHITKHAYDRAKERMSWKKRTLDRMAEKALTNGVKHKDTKGRLNKHISEIWRKYKNANNVRIYGQDFFLFRNNTLITVYRVPNDLIKYL